MVAGDFVFSPEKSSGFCQTFLLAEKVAGIFVMNDILRTAPSPKTAASTSTLVNASVSTDMPSLVRADAKSKGFEQQSGGSPLSSKPEDLHPGLPAQAKKFATDPLKSGLVKGNVLYISNLGSAVDASVLENALRSFGHVVSLKCFPGRGYAICEYSHFVNLGPRAKAALKVNDIELLVSHFVKKSHHLQWTGQSN